MSHALMFLGGVVFGVVVEAALMLVGLVVMWRLDLGLFGREDLGRGE